MQVPVNLLYHIHAGPMLSVYLGGGPYIAYGLHGTITSGQTTETFNFNSPRNNFQPLTFKNPDAGATFLAGLIIPKKITADVGYDLGLNSVSNSSTDIRTRVVHVSVGYLV